MEMTKIYKLQKQHLVNGKLDWSVILSVHTNKDLLMTQMKNLKHNETDPTICYSVVWYQTINVSHRKQPL